MSLSCFVLVDASLSLPTPPPTALPRPNHSKAQNNRPRSFERPIGHGTLHGYGAVIYILRSICSCKTENQKLELARAGGSVMGACFVLSHCSIQCGGKRRVCCCCFLASLLFCLRKKRGQASQLFFETKQIHFYIRSMYLEKEYRVNKKCAFCQIL